MVRSGRSGFTLIELLVVIAIIAILVSLLLPAVQQVREAARKTQCADHLHNIGIALHGYEGSNRALPIGARAQRAVGVAGIGPSWWVGILPNLEQKPLYDGFDHVGHNNGAPIAHAANRVWTANQFIDVMRCPSSPLPEMDVVSGTNQMSASYVGIAGATDHWGLTGLRLNNCCLTTPVNGQLSGDGLLVTNRSIRFAEAQDGLSNTMLVGEASNFSFDANGAKLRTDGSNPNNWTTGTSGLGTPPSFLGASAAAPPQVWNLTTLRHAPNSRYNAATGMRPSHGANNPLSSAHAGGVQVVLGDCVVKFISENLNIPTLQRLGVRDDATVLGVY